MTPHADERKENGKPVDDDKKNLDHDNRVDQVSEKLASQDCMLFDKLREVIEPRCWQVVSRAISIDNGPFEGDLPIDKVRNTKPSRIPAYPINGSTHMAHVNVSF